MSKSQARACIWLFIALISSACAFALDPSLDVSQYAHTAWKVREGFTKGTIFSMAQTPDGYLWLGTESGLARFDGVQAIPWQPPNGEQLPSNFIQELLVSHDGTLWIGTDKGLASWKDGKFIQYPPVAGHHIYSLLQDTGGTIWFAAENPGRICSVRVGITQCYGEGSFGFSVSALYEDHKGNLWVSAETGLWRWAPGPSEHYRLPEGVQADALLEDDNGALLMTTNKSGRFEGHVNGALEGLKQLVAGKIRDYTLPAITGQFTPLRLFRSSDGSLWIGTIRGLLHLYKGRIDRFSVADGLSGDLVDSIFEDREGSVWVSTSTGLDRFREFAIPTVSVNEGLSIAAVDVLQATSDDSIWIATADGLNRWQDGHMTVYGRRNVARPNGRTDRRPDIVDSRVTEVANSGLRNKVNSLGQDDRGQLWAASREGVFYFDRGRFVPVPGLPGGDTLSIAGDGHGTVWISNLDQGLISLTSEGAIQRTPWARFGHNYAAAALLPDRLQGGLWLGFVEGGIAYLKEGQIRSSYNTPEGLGNGAVTDLDYGSDGAVWAATDGGLSRVKDGRITTLTSKNGLPCDAVQGAIEDNDHSFWLYMSCGLVRISRSELDAWMRDSKRAIQTEVFDSFDGVWSFGRNGHHSPYVTKSPDGKIWFSSPDGVSIIDPRHLSFNKLPPPVHVEQITADGKSYDSSHNLRLPPRIRDLTIRYTALSLIAPEKVHFRFKLEGQDEGWREVVNNREVQYSNLRPGNYRFRVKASNNSGVWNEEGAVLDFSIAPAYWQTNWFRALCVAAFLTLLWAAYQVRVRQLRHQESKLRAVIENIPGMLFTALPGPSNEFVSRGWREYTGLSEEETAGLGWQKVVHPEDLEQHMEEWRVCSATGKPYENEVRFRRAANGEYRWFLVRAVPLRDEAGHILKWYGVLTDIEDRKRAEEALKRSQAYLAESQKLTKTGSWAHIPDGPALYWSAETFRISGFDPEQGLPDRETVWRRIHQEDMEKLRQILQKAYEQKADYTTAFRYVMPDGTVKHMEGTGHPVLNGAGEVVEFMGTMTDVTERKRAEEALRRSEAYLADAQRLTHTGSWAYEAGGDALYWSEENCRIWGFSPQQGVPDLETVHQRMHPEDRDREIDYAQRAVRAGKDFAQEFRIVLPDGNVRHIQAVGHPVFSASGEVTEVLGTHIDITERKRAEQEREKLRQLEAELTHKNRVTMLGELASSLAHEINQPITGIITSANVCLRWLTRNPPDVERARAAAARIEGDGSRAAEIIQRLRTFYKTGAPPQRELVDINKVIDEMLVLLRNEATEHSILLRTELSPQLPQTRGDRVQLQQVLMNLMLNGIEAITDQGEITIRSQRTENGLLQISVRDTGVGLQRENVEQIFNAFYTTKPEGTGMGLAISRSIIEAHGGRLWATVDAQRGATFHFTVPAEANE